MKLRIILLLAIAAAAACHRDPGGVPAAAAKPKAGVRADAPSQHGLNREQLTAGMVEAVTQGKAQAPMNLKFDLLERPVQGQPLDVAIALLPQIAGRSAAVTVSGPDALQVDPNEQQFEFPGIEASQVYRHSIKLNPAAEGLYVLTVAVSLQHDQTSDSRVFAVPILVAAPAAAPGNAPSGTPAQQAAGHRG